MLVTIHRPGDSGTARDGVHAVLVANLVGFDVLRAHDRTHASATVGAVAHVDDIGETHQFFPGWTDLHDLDLLVAELVPDGCFDLTGDLIPQVGGIAQLGFSDLDP
jgi:hypothetical protein